MTKPSGPPMMIQEMITPPVSSPWVSISAMREPSGVVYQDRSSGSMLSVFLSLASGGLIPRTAYSRAVLSWRMHWAMTIWSRVPPVLKAFEQTGPRAASQALSWARMVALPDAEALSQWASCTASMVTSVVSALAVKHCSMVSVLDSLEQLAGDDT